MHWLITKNTNSFATERNNPWETLRVFPGDWDEAWRDGLNDKAEDNNIFYDHSTLALSPDVLAATYVYYLFGTEDSPPLT